uniref:Uncharacterized protein n=1 Tax=Anopheles merus TaxID=30066 RepID=A0A182V016_ANOME
MFCASITVASWRSDSSAMRIVTMAWLLYRPLEISRTEVVPHRMVWSRSTRPRLRPQMVLARTSWTLTLWIVMESGGQDERTTLGAAFWLERNTQAFEAAATVLGGHGPPPTDAPCSAQNSCTRSSSGFSWSRSPGKYCPFSSQPSTNAISPPVRQSTFTCLIVTSMVWSGSATKYTPHTVVAPSEGSSGSARSADSTPGVIQWAPCLDVDLTGGSLTKENSPSSDVTCIQSAGNGFGREEQHVIVVSRSFHVPGVT